MEKKNQYTVTYNYLMSYRNLEKSTNQFENFSNRCRRNFFRKSNLIVCLDSSPNFLKTFLELFKQTLLRPMFS